MSSKSCESPSSWSGSCIGNSGSCVDCCGCGGGSLDDDAGVLCVVVLCCLFGVT